MARQRVTSGLFPVEFAGNGATLYLFVSSFHHEPHTVPVQVVELLPQGTKTPLREGQVPVAPFEAGRATFDGLDGRTVEVILDLPDPALKPSLSLVGTFAADGAQETLLWIPPGGFSPLAPDTVGGGRIRRLEARADAGAGGAGQRAQQPRASTRTRALRRRGRRPGGRPSGRGGSGGPGRP